MLTSCPKCSHNHITKDGIVKNKQRYKCKSCNYRFTVQQKNAKMATDEIKRMALHMYLEGLGFRSIGRILNFSHVAVYQWIKSYGENFKELVKSDSNKNIKIVEIDEMHSYIGSKKTTVGYGLLLIDMEKSLSILSLATETLKQDKNFGIK